MPGFDGLQTIAAIREREQLSGGHLPVIMLTARTRREDREKCLAAGMDGFLSKPMRAAELVVAINRVTSTRVIFRGELTATNAGAKESLIDPRVLLATCGGDSQMLEEMCCDFKMYSPMRVLELTTALEQRNGPRLREAAHKSCGLLSAFSSAAGNIAAQLEDVAAASQFDEARPLVELLKTMIGELTGQVNGLTIVSLRRQLAATDDATVDSVL
jgi:CheY-like chemotaxis protein